MRQDEIWDVDAAQRYDTPGTGMFAPEVLGPTVDRLAELAAGGRALELAIGTGRVAVPLAERGVPVTGIELSAPMVDRLRTKVDEERVPVVLGDMATASAPGEFTLVYLVFNTISNLLTQAEQVACFRNAARHLAPGGRFVVELLVPDLQRLPPGALALPFEVSPSPPTFHTAWVISGYEPSSWGQIPKLRIPGYGRRDGLRPSLEIVLRMLMATKQDFVRGMIYPVPDPRYPFLGVHFTRRVSGGLEVGPNAFLALSRRAYGRMSLSPRDLGSTLAWPGFWRFAGEHWRTGLTEIRGVLSKRAYMKSAQRYVPDIGVADVTRSHLGLRAQAVERNGSLVDDFVIQQEDGITSVRNAPSPAATSSLAIAQHVVDRIEIAV